MHGDQIYKLTNCTKEISNYYVLCTVTDKIISLYYITCWLPIVTAREMEVSKINQQVAKLVYPEPKLFSILR